MNRRLLLASIGSGASVGLAGCTGILPCGPSDPSFEDVAADPDQYDGTVVDVEGEVQRVGATGITLVLDDGMGTAELVAPTGYAFDTDIVSEGDCHYDEGRVRPPDTWSNSSADVKIQARPPDA